MVDGLGSHRQRVAGPRTDASLWALTRTYPFNGSRFVVRTIWSKDEEDSAHSRFRSMKNVSSYAVLSELQTLLKLFGDKLEKANTKYQPVYIMILTKLGIPRKTSIGVTRHQVRVLTSPNLGIQIDRCQLEVSGSLAELLNPKGLQVNDVLVILGGTFDVLKSTLHFRTSTNKNQLVFIPFHIFHFIQKRIVQPEDGMRPYSVAVDTSKFQLLYTNRNRTTLLKIIQLDPFDIVSSSKLKQGDGQGSSSSIPANHQTITSKSTWRKLHVEEPSESDVETDSD